MPEIFEKLGLDYKLIIAQAVNFVLLLVILQRIAYKPVLKILNERSEKIEKSLKQAQKIEEELKNTEEMKIAEIKKAREEAKKILEESQEISNMRSREAFEKTKKKTQEIVEKAKEEIKSEKEKAIKEAKEEIADISIEIAKKIINGNINENTQKKIINETLAKINKK